MQANHLETFRVGSTAYLGELVTLGTKSSSTQMQTDCRIFTHTSSGHLSISNKTYPIPYHPDFNCLL
jgi:hypothetical protein